MPINKRVITSIYSDSTGKRFASERWKKYYDSFYKHDPNYIEKRKIWQKKYRERTRNQKRLKDTKRYHDLHKDSRFYSKSLVVDWNMWVWDIEPLVWAGAFNINN